MGGIFYNKTLNEAERFRLADNIASHLCNAQEFIQERAIKNFASADAAFGGKIRELIDTTQGNRRASPAEPSRPAFEEHKNAVCWVHLYIEVIQPMYLNSNKTNHSSQNLTIIYL